MDKTLADYINRAMTKIKEQNSKDIENKNQYPVYPEKQNENSDEKINPYGQH